MNECDGESYLPKWVRDFRESINKSRLNYDSSILKIESLRSDLKTFDEIYLKGRDVMGHSLTHPPLIALAVNTQNEITVKSSTESPCKESKNYLFLLPSELLTLILDHVRVNDVLNLEKTANGMRQVLTHSPTHSLT